MGVQLLQSDKMVQQHQFQQLVNSQLREADQQVLSYFTELEAALLKTPSFQQTNTQIKQGINNDLIRQHIQQSPYIENIFILNAEGKRLFPAQPAESLKEQRFVTDTQELWQSMEAFQPNIPTDLESIKERRIQAEKTDDSSFKVSGSLGKIVEKNRHQESDSPEKSGNTFKTSRSIFQNKLTNIKINTGHGWTVWRAGNDTQIFFWFWNKKNQLTGLKLINAFWLSELINRLPDDRNASNIIGNARIQLVNEKRDVIYQWGEFEHSLINDIQAQSQRILAHPLDGWRLVYFSPTSTNNNLQWLFYLGVILFMGLAAIALGIYIFREYRRDMRTAAQRVTFVNQVSHELKTPLTNICLYAELLESECDDNKPDSKARRYTQVLTSESQRLGRLINNVLSFSRSQKHEQRIKKQTNNMNDAIHATVDMFKPAFFAKDIEIELKLKTDKSISFDRNALEQIINNLLGNVEKYAASGKHVSIESIHKQNMAEIHVIDRGPGITKKISKRLFEQFYRGSEKLTEGVSGTGIGLNIARDLCRLHGGDLILNQQYTDGAHFIATLNTQAEAEIS